MMLKTAYQKYLLFSILIIFFLINTSCDQKNDVSKKETKAETGIKKAFAEGREYDLFIIGDNIRSDESIQSIIEDIFEIPVPVLPQNESLFRSVFLDVKDMDDKIKKNLSLLFLDIEDDENNTKAFLKSHFADIDLMLGENESFKYNILENSWVYPQKIIICSASDLTAMKEGLSKNKYVLIREFENSEKLRIKRRVYANGRNNTQSNQLYKNFKLSMSVPKGYVNILERKNQRDTLLQKTGLSSLIWYRWTTEQANSNFIIYTMPYNKSSLPSDAELLMIKNRLTKKLVHGQNTGSYLTTATKHYAPQGKNLRMGNLETREIRGLWETEGDWMGGPFIFYAMNDPAHERIVFIDAFVYAAGISKKPFLKRFEAIFETIRPY